MSEKAKAASPLVAPGCDVCAVNAQWVVELKQRVVELEAGLAWMVAQMGAMQCDDQMCDGTIHGWYLRARDLLKG